MVQASHEEDPTRKAAAGGAQRWNLDDPEISDVAGLNGDGGGFYLKWDGDERVDDPESDRPQSPQVISEYGSEVGPTGEISAVFTITSGEPDRCISLCRAQMAKRKAVWCGYHHGRANDMGHMGIVDIIGFRAKLVLVSIQYCAEQSG